MKLAKSLSSPNPGLHPNYWKALYGLGFQLRLESATKLLKIHPNFHTEAFQSAFELLKKMPVFSANISVSAPEFTFRWNHWKEECESRIQSGDFFEFKDLELLVEILIGKEDSFDKISDVLKPGISE